MGKENINVIIKKINEQIYERKVRVIDLVDGTILGKDVYTDYVPLKSVWAEITRLNTLENIQWEDKPSGRYAMVEYSYSYQNTLVETLTALRTIDFTEDNVKIEKEYLIIY